MKIFPQLLAGAMLALPALSGHGQVPDPGQAAQQDPGIAQDTEAAREKMLKAADQLDLLEANSESNKAALDAMKGNITQLQTENTDLKQQLAAMQAALDKAEAGRVQERQDLLNEVAALVAKNGAGSFHHHALPEVAQADAPPTAPDSSSIDSAPTEVHHAAASPPHDTPPPAPKPQKGYYHVVQSGETLAMICEAYRDQGVKVSLTAVRKANGLTSHSVLKPGQKLFIPKPVE